jgi:RNA polymerase sigma factor (sigma-70 family)
MAIQLETLVYRDGHSFADAVVMLRERLALPADGESSDAALEALFGELPARTPRRWESDEGLEQMAAPVDPEGDVLSAERGVSAEDVSRRLTEALCTLEPQDALVLRLRFAEGMKVVDIARRLGLEQRKLYGRIEKMLRSLRHAILDCGITEEQVRDLLGWDALALDVDFGGGRDVAPPAGEPVIDFSPGATARADGSGPEGRG